MTLLGKRSCARGAMFRGKGDLEVGRQQRLWVKPRLAFVARRALQHIELRAKLENARLRFKPNRAGGGWCGCGVPAWVY